MSVIIQYHNTVFNDSLKVFNPATRSKYYKLMVSIRLKNHLKNLQIIPSLFAPCAKVEI